MDVTTLIFSIASSAISVAASAVVNHRVTSATQGLRLDNHDRRLDGHDKLHEEHAARFATLTQDFVPRREADLQFQAMQKSLERSEVFLRYLVFGKKPDPPEEV